jgi:hypothetical protein
MVAAEQRLRVLVLLLEPGQHCLVLDEEVEPLGALTLPAHVMLRGLGVADRHESAVPESVKEALVRAAGISEACIGPGLLRLVRCARTAHPGPSQYKECRLETHDAEIALHHRALAGLVPGQPMRSGITPRRDGFPGETDQ